MYPNKNIIVIKLYASKKDPSKMAFENSSKWKLKTYTSARKNTFALVTMQNLSFWDNISWDWEYNAYPQSYKRL